MATVTDADLQEIKTAIESLMRLTEANAKAIADLTLDMRVGFANVDTKFAVLREEMQVGFASVDTKFARLEGRIDNLEAKLEGKIDNLETKLEGQINTVEAKLTGKIDQLDERTKLGFWGFIFRGTALAALAALTAIFVKYLFPILPTELPRL
jgi:chromosome segregation ATPase